PGACPVRFDPQLRLLGELLAVDVDADHLVPVEVAPGERAVAAAEVEHAPAGPSDVAAKELGPLGPGEDEVAPARRAVVLAVALAQLLQVAHRAQSRRARASAGVEFPARAQQTGSRRRSPGCGTEWSPRRER